MPSFLTSLKVFGRKNESPVTSGELLGGKFEAISPNVSPSAAHYLELQPDHGDLDKDFTIPFFRTKSRPSSPEAKPKRLFESLPPLSLDFNDLKDKSAYNGYIFEESDAVFSDDLLAQRRLNPTEALLLIRACSKAIISRGLETLGIMTPHWYSASPDVQRKLISKFLRSLDLTSAKTPNLTSFEDQLNCTRSIHDVAAVFRWALRHIQLESDCFATNRGWYKAFLDAETANDYPPNTFSQILVPHLPTTHLELLISTLEVFSSLAAFSESNSTSGSKLSKMFGLWLLTTPSVEDKDDWRTFYAKWERTGRMLEHLFLARIRDQSSHQRLPTRLLDLVRKYPYTQDLSSPKTDLQLLPYPQFTTALDLALFVRVQYQVPSQKHVPTTRINPSVLLADAFSTKVDKGEFVELWAKITSAAFKTGTESPLGNVLANETLRLLSLVPKNSTEDVKSPTFSLLSLSELQRHASLGAASIKPTTESAPLTTSIPLSPIGSDWEHFSASGFLNIEQTFPPLASTLFDTDIEKTEPREGPLPMSRKSSKRAARRSLELTRSVVISDLLPESAGPNSKEGQGVITASHLEVIELDEAFVDFWSDALLDPVTSEWPSFVVCKFKPALVPELTGDATTKKPLKWLVLEQVYSVKPRPVSSSPQAVTAVPSSEETSVRPASPIAQSPSSGRRLLNFWSMSRTPSSSSTSSQKGKKALRTPKVGEMGELIEEEDAKKDAAHSRMPVAKKFRSLDLPGVKKLAGKRSDKIERAKSVDVTSSASPTVAAAVATAIKEVDLSTVLEPVAESSEPALNTDAASKPEVIPAEVTRDVEIVDTGAGAEHVQESALILDENQETAAAETQENEADLSVVQKPVEESSEEAKRREDGPEEEPVVVEHALVEKAVVVEASEESAVPLLSEDDVPKVASEQVVVEGQEIATTNTAGERQIDENATSFEDEDVVRQSEEVDQILSISEASASEPSSHQLEVGPISSANEEHDKPIVAETSEERLAPETEGERSASSEAEGFLVATVVASTGVASVRPEVEKEPDVKADEPVGVDADLFPAADEVPAPVVEDESPLPEADVSELVVDNPSVEVEDIETEGAPVSVEGIHAPEVVLAPGDSLSSAVDNVVVEGISPVSELPIANDTQSAQGSSDLPQEKDEESLEAPESSSLGVEVDLAVQETHAPVVPTESTSEEPASLAEVPVQESSVNEEAPGELVALSVGAGTPEPLTTEHASIVGESTGAGERGIVDEEPQILEEHAQEALSLEPEAEAVIDGSVDAGVVESQEAIEDEVLLSEAQPEEQPMIDSSQELSASEAVSDAGAVESGQEVAPAESGSGDRPVIEAAEELPISEAVIRAVDQVGQETHEMPIEPEVDQMQAQSPIEELNQEPYSVVTEDLSELKMPVKQAEAANEGTLTEATPTEDDRPSEVVASSEVGDASIPEEETTLELPEQVERCLEPAADDVLDESVPIIDLPLSKELTPPPVEEALAEPIPEATAASEEVRVAEETPAVVEENVEPIEEIIEQPQEKATWKESETPIPEVSEGHLPVADEGVFVTAEAEESIETSADPEDPLVGDAPGIVEPSSRPTDESLIEDSTDVAEQAPAADEELTLPANEASDQVQDLSATLDDAVAQEPSPPDTTPVDEQPGLEHRETIEEISEESTAARDEPVHDVKDFTPEEPISSVAEDENNMLSIPAEECPQNLEEEVSPPVDEAPTSEGAPPVIEGASDGASDASQPGAAVADDTLIASVGANLDTISHPDAEAESPVSSSALKLASDLHAEASEQEYNAANLTEELPANVDQPKHSQESENLTREEGLTHDHDPTSFEADPSVEKPKEHAADATLTGTTTDIPYDEEPAHTDSQVEKTVTMVNALDPVSIPEHGIKEPLAETVVEPDTPDSLAEPSPPIGQSAHPDTEAPSTIPEHIGSVANDANPLVKEEITAVEKPSEEPIVDQSEETSLDLSNGSGNSQIPT